jgi:hypothetical protein
MILGLAMISLNPALEPGDRTTSVQAATRLMFDGTISHPTGW